MERVTAVLYFAARDAEQAQRIVNRGFVGLDRITALLPYGDPENVDQPGILVSDGLDPSSGPAVELEFLTNTSYLQRHELIRHVRGVRCFPLMHGDTLKSRLRQVSEVKLQIDSFYGSLELTMVRVSNCAKARSERHETGSQSLAVAVILQP